MEKTQWFQNAMQSVLDTDEEAAKKISIEALEAGMDPLEMINQGFTEGIRKMGDLFERGEVFLAGPDSGIRSNDGGGRDTRSGFAGREAGEEESCDSTRNH